MIGDDFLPLSNNIETSETEQYRPESTKPATFNLFIPAKDQDAANDSHSVITIEKIKYQIENTGKISPELVDQISKNRSLLIELTGEPEYIIDMLQKLFIPPEFKNVKDENVPLKLAAYTDRTTSEAQKVIHISSPEQEKFRKIILELREAIETAPYEGKDLDIKSLERIESLSPVEPSPLDSPALKGLMTWGVNFYTRKLKVSQPSKENVWKEFVEKMHNSYGILVIHESGTLFNFNDHHIISGLAPTLGAIVERVVKPGYKVSANSIGGRYGQKGRVIEQAHVVLGCH